MKRHVCIYFIIFILTILDLIFTAKGIKLGVITEANPIIAYFIERSLGLTFFCIMAYVGGALLLIYRLSPGIWWLNATLAGLAGIKLYALVLHMQWLSGYFGISL